MQKLLSLVLSISILCSSVTPAWSQVREVGRGVIKGLGSVPAVGTKQVVSPITSSALIRRVYAQMAFANSTVQSRIAAGHTAGLAKYMLSLPVAKRTAVLRQDFVALSFLPQAVSLPERVEAGALLEQNLAATKDVFSHISQTNLADFLKQYQARPQEPRFIQVQNTLADGAALAFVGTQEQAPALLAFYEQARGTLFEETAALITARGLLQMQAYEDLSGFLLVTENQPILAGVAAYSKMKGLPVEVPAALQQIAIPAANKKLAAFLSKPFEPNHFHADPSIEATRDWLGLRQPEEVPAALEQTVANQSVSLQPLEPVKIAAEPLELPSIEPLVLVPTFAQATTTASAPKASTVASKPTVSAPVAKPVSYSSSEGILYSGVPVFAIIEASKRALNWMRKKLAKKSDQAVPTEQAATIASEEPGLHDNKVRLILDQLEDVPSHSSIGGDLVGAGNVKEVLVGVDGLKLTVEGEDRVEHILHNVDLTVSADLKNFSPEFNRLALDTNYIFELRNGTVPAERPDHFFFTLSIQNGEFAKLIEGAGALNLSRPVRIKIQQTTSPKKSVTVPVYKYVDKTTLQETALVTEVDTSLLRGVKNPEDGRVVWVDKDVYGQATLLYQEENGDFRSLQNAFVRLPKAESKYWTQILQMYPQQPFHLTVLSTKGKMVPVTYLVPSLQIGLGKTLAPALNGKTDFSEDEASNVMLGINNVLPAFMGLLHPILKRYGEAAVFRIGTGLFSLGGITALSSGLYGQIGEAMTNWQLAGFLTSSVLIALGTNVTRFVQNPLIRSNRGIVPQKNSFQKEKKKEVEDNIIYDTHFLAKRVKDVFMGKSAKSLRDVFYYQLGAMFKNLGTAAFLACPWLVNLAGKAFGYDLGLDFSASYVPYTLYSLYVLRKVYKTRYKDAFPLNKTVLSNNLQDLQNNMAVKINQIPAVEKITAEHPVIKDAAKQLQESIHSLAVVEAREQKTGIEGLVLGHEAEIGKEIKELLLLAGWTPERAGSIQTALQQAFDVLGERDVKWYQKMWKALKIVGLPASLAGMTAATFCELGLSNGFAFAIRDMLGIENTTESIGIVGVVLYGCMAGWRVLGNWLSKRLKGGSMYALSSAVGIAGTGIMAAAMHAGNMGLLVGGAIMACFGISNFYSQMYEYMVGLGKNYEREIVTLITYTMPIAALPVGILKSDWFKGFGIPGLDMAICGAALAASVALTPGMLANSSLVEFAKYEWKKLMAKFRGGPNKDEIPPAQPAPAQ